MNALFASARSTLAGAGLHRTVVRSFLASPPTNPTSAFRARQS
jgi:hypothetical protein